MKELSDPSTDDAGNRELGANTTKAPKEKKMLAKVILAFLLMAMIWLLSSGFRSKTSVLLTQEQARGYVSIIAAVIPIFVIALYVDGAKMWKGLTTAFAVGLEQVASAPVEHLNGKRRIRNIFIRTNKWTGVPVTPLQLLSPLLGEVFALGCYLLPTSSQIRMATAWMASLLGLFAFRLVSWAATPDDEASVRWSAVIGAILILLVFAGYIPFIFKISIAR